jgi:hypothetical protein
MSAFNRSVTNGITLPTNVKIAIAVVMKTPPSILNIIITKLYTLIILRQYTKK